MTFSHKNPLSLCLRGFQIQFLLLFFFYIDVFYIISFTIKIPLCQ
nr:MAG TPA: hypothetical protein [Bacteriophage sp.]